MCLWSSVIRTIGQVADDAANVAAELPLKLGAVAGTSPTAGTPVTAADKVHLLTDLLRRLRVAIAREYYEWSWVDSATVAADAYYPAEAGWTVEAFETLTLTGKIITGADNTSILTIEVSNDEDATPGNRDWKAIYWYDNAADGNINQLASLAGVTTTFAWSLNGLGFRYVRVKYDITRGTTNTDTVIIKARAQG
jgi:hypothetical protein